MIDSHSKVDRSSLVISNDPKDPRFARGSEKRKYLPANMWDKAFWYGDDGEISEGPFFISRHDFLAKFQITPPTVEEHSRELALVVSKLALRPQARDLIMAQANDDEAIRTALATQLKITPQVVGDNFQATLSLLKDAYQDLAVIFLTLKCFFNRARPYQYPGYLDKLDPMFYPGHAAFPSGHACGHYFVAGFCDQLLRRHKVKALSKTKVAAGYAYAWDVAHNREIAGVHFPSDSFGGRTIGLAFAEELFSVAAFKERLEKRCLAEWNR